MSDRKYKEMKTNAPAEPEYNVQATGIFSDRRKTYPGDSVKDHKDLEAANEQLTGDEIKQQNENL
ncbi:MAG: hypothetical protein H0Z32_01205 [Bacillaceae bacterium]|nr:hypothetical protein [Bacillaceae bacterium]